MPKPIWRVEMKFKGEPPLGLDVTYIRARLASEAIEIARHNHKTDHGGFVDGTAKKVRDRRGAARPEGSDKDHGDQSIGLGD